MKPFLLAKIVSTTNRSKYLRKVHNILGIKGMSLKVNELAILILDKKKRKQPKQMTYSSSIRIIDEFMKEYGVTFSKAVVKLKQGTSFVYFIQQDGGERHIKIGKADNVETRLLELQTGSPYPLVIIHKIIAENKSHALALEKMLHTRVKKYRLMGEWFTQESLNDLRDILKS